MVLNWEQLATFEDIPRWGAWTGRDGCYWHLWGRGWDAAKHSIMHRTTAHNKLSSPNISFAEVEKSCFFFSAKNTAGRQSQINRGTLKCSGEPLKDLNRRISWPDGILCFQNEKSSKTIEDGLKKRPMQWSRKSKTDVTSQWQWGGKEGMEY